MTWFSNDPDGNGVEFHGTEKKAREAAEVAMDGVRETVADDQYHMNECGSDICYGKVVGQVVETRKDVSGDPSKKYDTEITFELLQRNHIPKNDPYSFALGFALGAVVMAASCIFVVLT